MTESRKLYMESFSMRYFVFICLITVLLTSCSSDQDEESTIDRAVQKTADKAVKYIQEPIDKAEAIKEVEEERTRKLEEQVQ